MNKDDKIEGFYNDLVLLVGLPTADYLSGKTEFLVNNDETIKKVFEWVYAAGYDDGNRATVIFDNRVQVDRYDADGQFVQTYDSITDAANDVKVTQSTMSEAVIRGTRCRQHYWVRHGQKFSLEDAIARLGQIAEESYAKIGTPVEQLNGYRQPIKPFRSINEAAKSVKADRRSIVMAIENNTYFKGYFWRYKVS